MTAKHRPPSQVRYAATHPQKTIHFDQETFDMVEALLERSGLTWNQFIRQELGSMERHIDVIQERGRACHIEEGRNLGFADGYAKAIARFRLAYACSGCGEPLGLEAGEADACRALELLMQEGWGHDECVVVKPAIERPKPGESRRPGPRELMEDPLFRQASRAASVARQAEKHRDGSDVR
jgi:hypothetical protein